MESVLLSDICQSNQLLLQHLNTEEESSDDDILLALTLSKPCKRKRNRIQDYIPKVMNTYTEREFRFHFHFSRHLLDSVLGCFSNSSMMREKKAGRPHTDCEKVVLISLWYFANTETHQQLADRFQLCSESYSLLPEPTVLLLHEAWPDVVGAWTIFPILGSIARDYVQETSDIQFVMFCDEETDINLVRLLDELKRFDFNEELFLGHALQDREAVIIHHFAFYEDPSKFQYPDLAAGFLLSTPLVKRLASRMENSPPAIDFSIDIQHEFALYVWDSGSGTPLTNAPFLCGFNENPDNCATVRLSKFPKCNQRTVNRNEVTFAVKTCEKYHLDRLTVVKKTWGKETENIEFFSDVSDPSIPTVTLGIPNTERGHCRKFMAILQHTYNELKTHKYKWIVIADDDTLISIPRLGKFLSCFDSNEVVILGERYGYGVVKGNGYDYITLGGGMVLSRTALQQLIDNESCRCASDDAPDDMTLGLCLKHVGIAVTHSPLFHQARPNDYAELYLANQDPVTFHKHWNVNPYEVYNKYLDVASSPDDVVRDEL